jgi:GT2 family glycosyltransferase
MSAALQRVTAGVLSYNRRDSLRRTLHELLALGGGLPVIVIENGSTDGSAGMLREEFPPDRHPQLRSIFLEENRGVAARNLLFEETDTDYLLTLDDDSWPRSAEDIERMVALMDGDVRVASVCASCIHPETGFEETRGIERFASAGDAERGYDVVNIAGGGSLLRVEAMRKTAGYDPLLFWGREENDLAFQLLLRGYRVVYYPGAVVWHDMSPAGRDVYRRLRYVTRNSYWLLWKYFPLAVALPLAALFLLRRLAACVRDPRRLTAVLGGTAEGLAGFARMRGRGTRLRLREALHHRGWMMKLLYE